MNFSWLMANIICSGQKAKTEIGYMDIKPSKGLLEAKQFERIFVSACAYDCMAYKSFSDYLKKINAYFEVAAKEHSSMIVFPQLFGVSCATFTANGKKIIANMFSENFTDLYLKDYIKSMGKWNINFYTGFFSALAKKYNMYVQPGSVLFYENGKIYNRSYMFDNNGFLVNHQDKLFPSIYEKNMGISAGNTINIMETDIGNFAILNGADSFSYEPAKIAKELGADAIISSCIDKDNLNPILHRKTVQWRCSEQNLFGIIPCSRKISTEESPISFVAPTGITEDLTGLLSTEPTEIIKTQRLNFIKLKKYFNSYTSDRNYPLYQKYFDNIY